MAANMRYFYNKKTWALEGMSFIEGFLSNKNTGFIDNLKLKKNLNVMDINNHKSYFFEEIGNYIIKSYFANEQVETYDIATNTKDLKSFLTHFNLTQFDDYKGNFNYHRGDFAIKNIHDQIILIDFKNYCSIMATWKPSVIIKKDLQHYTKTVDTNLKRLLQIKDFDFLLEKDFDTTLTSFDRTISISCKQLNDIMYYLEYGVLALNPDNRSKIKEKVFIRSNDRSGDIVIEKINWEKIQSNKDIKVVFHKEKYFYIGFYDMSDNLIYEVSMRDDLKPNCAFINKDFVSITNNENNLDAIDLVSIELKKML